MALVERNFAREQQQHRYSTRHGMFVTIPPTSKLLGTNSDLFPQNYPHQIDPFIEDSVQRFPLGTKLEYGHRVFRYAKAGAVALTLGKLMQSPVPLAGHINQAINEPAVGATTISFTPFAATTDDVAANALADGFIFVNDETGEGAMYQIKSHPALTGGAAGTITLVDPIIVAPVAAATATVLYPPWRNVILHPSPPTAQVVGVTVCNVTANYYCWLQVQGPCAVLTQGTLVIADLCVPSATVDGAVMPSVALETDGPVVGHVMAVNADTEYSAIWLDLP